MPIEWIEKMAFIKDFVTAIAAIVAACVAIIGLNTWQRQLKGTAEYDLAQRLLKAVYTLRQNIFDFIVPIKPKVMLTWGKIQELELDRNANTWGYEYPTPETEEGILDAKWSSVQDALTDFDVVSNEAKVLWRDEVTNKLTTIHNYVTLLGETYSSYVGTLRTMQGVEYFDRKDEDMERMWVHYDNLFGDKAVKIIISMWDVVIKNLEDYLDQYLKK